VNKKVIAILFSFLVMFSLTSCTGSKGNTVTNSQSSAKVEKKADTAAEEKNTALENKAQQGYDMLFQKKYKEAIALEDAVIKEDPGFYKAYYIKGIIQCYSGNYGDGSKNIDKALSLKPDDYMARFNKALSLEINKQYSEAIMWYNKALEIKKGEWSYYGIASIYGRKGDVSNTVKYLKLAIAINPNIKKEAENEPDFNPVKNSQEFINTIK